MNTSKEHIKILTSLSLASSDAREDTLKSVLLGTLNDLGNIKRSELNFYIKENFGFEPYNEELTQLIDKLIAEDKIIESSGKQLSLSDNEKNAYQNSEIKLRDKDKARYQNFRAFLIEEGFDQLDNVATTKLWKTFIEYIYNNFFDYGEEALKRLHPQISFSGKFENEEDYFQIAFKELEDKNLCEIFRLCVDKFPDYASQNDIDFLNDLAQKTLSFASLGIDPKLSNEAINISLVDWVLYLDTNVLYSILDLHSHPENEATKALFQLISDNQEFLKIKLRYSDLTKKELNGKRAEFDLLDERLPNSSIRALIKSNDVDDFSKQFYKSLLNNRESTLHPSKVIELSPNILKKRKIEVARNSKRIDVLGEDYLNLKIQDYRNFIDRKNEIKQEFCLDKNIPFYPIFKSDKQLIHDITLRELILDLRITIKNKKLEDVNFNSIKYFGLTLDGLLRNFDTSQLKDQTDEKAFPVFFRPSFLLNKLVRILPIKTDDYKKAFLKAVTSKGFNKDIRKSRDILKIVNYLKEQGIDDEKVIYNLISEDIFLEKFRKTNKSDDFDKDEFIESELNRQLKERQDELNKTKEELNETTKTKEKNLAENKILHDKQEQLESELSLYKKSLIKVQSDLVKIESKKTLNHNQQKKIDFEAEAIRSELASTKKELIEKLEEEIERHKIIELKKWQYRSIWNLIWAIPISIICVWIVLFPDSIPDSTIDKVSIRLIISLFLLIIDGIFIYIIKSRFWDEGNKESKKKNISVPKDLCRKIKELKSTGPQQ